MDPLRDKTDEELEFALHALGLIGGVLEGLGIDWFLIGGALLGGFRDGALIRWDKDIDIAVSYRELVPAFEDFHTRILSLGFNPKYKGRAKERGMAIPCSITGSTSDAWVLPIDIKAFVFEDGVWRMGRVLTLPEGLFNSEARVWLGDNEYPAPAPTEEAIEHFYGESWSKPVRRLSVEEKPHWASLCGEDS